MKRLVIVLAVLALLAGVLSVTLATTVGAQGQGPQPKTLEVVIGAPLVEAPEGAAEGGSTLFAEGERYFLIYELRDATGENVIGEYIFDSVATAPVTVRGWYASEHFHIDGVGTIEGIGHGPPWQGAIIGGTGAFAGASGEYAFSGPASPGWRITFTFEKPQR